VFTKYSTIKQQLLLMRLQWEYHFRGSIDATRLYNSLAVGEIISATHLHNRICPTARIVFDVRRSATALLAGSTLNLALILTFSTPLPLSASCAGGHVALASNGKSTCQVQASNARSQPKVSFKCNADALA
jgi:hypothetical protein